MSILLCLFMSLMGVWVPDLWKLRVSLVQVECRLR